MNITELTTLLTILFPVFPLFFLITVIFFYYIFKIDISKIIIKLTILTQLALSLSLIYLYTRITLPLTIPLSTLKYPIVFLIDTAKIYFLVVLTVPMIFSFFLIKQLETIYSRVIFSFYLAGCSGIIVTGDVFNFFVFYELMIMAAYILISLKKDYYASIKYMFFGAVSSTILLLAIITWFSFGEYFDFASINIIASSTSKSVFMTLTLFSMVFLIKGGFFPVSSWPAPCHSAAPGIVSSFLSSFTTFTSIYGLYYFVIQPAVHTDNHLFLKTLEFFALLTITAVPLLMLFEKDLRKVIAGSTPFSTGIVTLLLINGETRWGLIYMIIHAVLKTALFIIDDKIERNNGILNIGKNTYLIYVFTVITLSGLFPALTYFVKSLYTAELVTITLMTISAVLFAASFFKIRFTLSPERTGFFHILFIIIITSVYLYVSELIKLNAYIKPAIEILLLFIVFTTAGLIHTKSEFNIRKLIYRDFGYELLSIPVLFIIFYIAGKIIF